MDIHVRLLAIGHRSLVNSLRIGAVNILFALRLTLV